MALKFEQQVIHQLEGDFSKVNNLRLFGTNEEIGFKLGEIAKNQHFISRSRNLNTLKNKCQKEYLKMNYPIHFKRMKGLARAYSENIDTTEYDFTCFGNPLGINACSAVFYPPGYTKSNVGILSRNLDLPTISFAEMITGNGSEDIPAASNIYIVELYPDEGYPSLLNLSFELYGLGLDGINSEGLTVTHLYADSVNSNLYKPTNEYSIGINEMLIVQLLLDNCKNVDEAKEMLLLNKQFYMLLPTHFLIADHFGNSFVWEYSPQHNQEFIINGNSNPQIITNFPIHEFIKSDIFPISPNSACPFARYKTIENAIESTKTFSIDDIKKNNTSVFIRDEMFEVNPKEKVRTIYHNLYNTNQKSMEISFYRKDDGEYQLRTEYFKFILD